MLKDYRRGLPISDMLREIVNRGLRNFDGNKNPLGQVTAWFHMQFMKGATSGELPMFCHYCICISMDDFLQIAGDLVRDRAHFFHFSGTNIWCLRCALTMLLPAIQYCCWSVSLLDIDKTGYQTSRNNFRH